METADRPPPPCLAEHSRAAGPVLWAQQRSGFSVTPTCVSTDGLGPQPPFPAPRQALHPGPRPSPSPYADSPTPSAPKEAARPAQPSRHTLSELPESSEPCSGHPGWERGRPLRPALGVLLPQPSPQHTTCLSPALWLCQRTRCLGEQGLRHPDPKSGSAPAAARTAGRGRRGGGRGQGRGQGMRTVGVGVLPHEESMEPSGLQATQHRAWPCAAGDGRRLL